MLAYVIILFRPLEPSAIQRAFVFLHAEARLYSQLDSLMDRFPTVVQFGFSCLQVCLGRH